MEERKAMKIKQWIGVLLCTLLCVGILPTTAFAAEKYNVLIEGNWVTSDNASDVLNDGGSVTYDKDSNTVTLNSATLSSNIYCNTGSALNIVVNGTNTMNCSDKVSTAISVFGNYPINISGSGSLKITVAIYEGNAIRGDAVTIDGTTLELYTSGTALSGYPLTLKNGANVTAKLSEGSNSVAVSGDSIEIIDSTLTATAPLGNSILGDSIKIENSTVIGTGYYPVMSNAGDITIINSTVTAESTANWGMWSKGNLLIEGSSDVTATGSVAALGAATSFTLKPQAGELIDVFVGTDKDNAATIDNSPLSQETDLRAYGNSNIKYFHSTPHTHTYDQQIVSDEYKAIDATCTEPAKYYCSCVCGAKGTETFESGTAADHKAGTEWKSDETKHWNECVNCGEKLNEATHDFKWITDKEATATEAGSKHEECEICGFKKSSIEIPAIGTKPNDKTDNSSNNGNTTKMSSTDKTSKAKTNSPKTGDNTNVGLYISLLTASGLFVAILTVLRKKKAFGHK